MPQLYNDGTLYNYNEFNRFPNLDGVEYKMVNELLHNPSQYAENIWKLIGYTTPDALVRDNLTLQQKAALICDENDTLETGKRVFITPYINDAWTDQSAHLHIYVELCILLTMYCPMFTYVSRPSYMLRLVPF